MFFKKHEEPKALGAGERLNLLSNRLTGSIYYEDRADALEKILEMSKVYPVEVGVHALEDVICSMERMDDVSIHLKILSNVLRCIHRLEFIDIIVKNSESLRILCDCIGNGKSGKEVYDLLCVLSVSEFFSPKAVGIPSMAHYCVQMVKEKRMGLIPRLALGDLNFRRELTFMGIFENLLKELQDEFSRDAMSTLALLLKDSPFNQNYFNELRWDFLLKYIDKHPNEVFDVLSALIDLKNIEFQKLQSSVYRRIDLVVLLEFRRWDLLYLIVKDNQPYTEKLLETSVFDKIEEWLPKETLTTKQNELYLLVDYLLFWSNPDVSKMNSYKIYTMKSLREQDISTNDLMEGAFKIIGQLDSREETVVFDALIFIIFNFEKSRAEKMISVLSEIFCDYTKPKLHRFLCLIILLMLETPVDRVNINHYTAYHLLREARFLLCSIDLNSPLYLTNEMVDILVNNIGDLVRIR
ncbi:putative vesicular transport protein [Encephalitozoon intestinalis ATCC 50506]|uniref:Vesicular transport protein n=1 Tax=Encephalitozoon intestinalis (strain ATCC 50506) TaxID=876142 RepID=E0S8F2_ENCIT|nr:putative vesicular transport protein [Encephalitozoon intestinalis ATCC 50506]ADM11946.1 putative vesicular transport protein [Encephalitozoon intestinalis ATCC 50506]UTX45729.1 general vesicular transport factor [Encephalitozoon intestinalis]